MKVTIYYIWQSPSTTDLLSFERDSRICFLHLYPKYPVVIFVWFGLSGIVCEQYSKKISSLTGFCIPLGYMKTFQDSMDSFRSSTSFMYTLLKLLCLRTHLLLNLQDLFTHPLSLFVFSHFRYEAYISPILTSIFYISQICKLLFGALNE